VHECPSVLPIGSIEPKFWPAASVCTELPLRSGFLDNLLITPLGDLIAVECKLWRNIEARREVVAQIIDYAKDLQTLSYEKLELEVRRRRKEPNFSLYRHASAVANEPEPLLDEPTFIDTLSRNLHRGRSLLLIVGDGVTESVEAMSDFLQQHAGIHFALALIQLAVHELAGEGRRIIVPSIPMRTVNIVRGIVQVLDGRAVVSAPPTSVAREATTLSEEDLFDALDRREPRTSERLLKFLQEVADLQITYEVKKTLIVRMIVEEHKVLPFVITAEGNVDTGYTAGLKEVCHRFVEKLALAIPGSVARETPKTWTLKKQAGGFVTVWDLLADTSRVRAALEELNAAMRALEK
jgi:hypothetical protein